MSLWDDAKDYAKKGAAAAIGSGLGGVAGGVPGAIAGGVLGVDAVSGGGGSGGGNYSHYNPTTYGQDPGFFKGYVGDLGNEAHALGNANDITRYNQEQFRGTMLGAAMGNAPSAAEIQMRQGQAMAAAQANQMAASTRGGAGNYALAQRDAINANNVLGAQTNMQAGMLRAQEMAHARDAYAGYLGGIRDQNQQGALGYEGARQNVLGEEYRGQQAASGAELGAMTSTGNALIGERGGLSRDETSTKNTLLGLIPQFKVLGA